MKRAFSLVEALILMAVTAGFAIVLWPLFARVRDDPPHRAICKSNLAQIGISISQYTQDYNGKLPPVHVAPLVGWADSIFPYVKSQEVFQCDKGTSNSATSFTTDYFYNGRLDRIVVNKIKEPTRIILLGDGDDNAPTWNSWTKMPSDAATNSYSPTQRHLNGASYCFADGHTKWLKPYQITEASLKPDEYAPTFAVR